MAHTPLHDTRTRSGPTPTYSPRFAERNTTHVNARDVAAPGKRRLIFIADLNVEINIIVRLSTLL